jgi:mannose-6-phosphate isomerase-like protein (cupin superfamily)
MPSIQNKTELGRRRSGPGAMVTPFLQALAPDLKGTRGELFFLQSGGELEWTHPEGTEAFFFATHGVVVVEMKDRREKLKEHSVLWLEAGDRVTLRNEGSEEAELLYLQAC